MKTSITALTLMLTTCILSGCATNAHLPFMGDDGGAMSAQAVLTAEQLQTNFLGWKFGMFIHFNMATFNEREWATGCEEPATFAPDRLNCKQWVKAAQAAGMKYAVLTVKHVKIVSEKGRDCTMVNPWPEKSIRLIRSGKRSETLRGKRVTFKTTANEVIELTMNG